MVLPGALAAQSVPGQAQHYLSVADVIDGRAVWVNPAGLARRPEASFGVFASGEELSGNLRLAQYGLQVASRGIAFGWQHDDLRDGRRAGLYVLSAGLGDARLGVGGSRRWYRTSFNPGSSWDLGLHATALPFVDVAAVWRDIGSPTVGDSILEESLILGAGASFLGRLRVSGEWQAATSGFVTRRARATVALVAGRGLALSAAADFSSNPRLRAVSLALHLARPRTRFSGWVRDPESAAAPAGFGVSAMSVTPPPRRR
jgi:hypothetical protein